MTIYSLGDLVEFQNGFAFKSREYSPSPVSGCEVLRMGYISRGGGFKEDDKPVYASEDSKGNQERYRLKKDDLVMAMTDMKNNVAILGCVAYIKNKERFLLNQRVGRLRVKESKRVNPRYLYFLLNSKMVLEDIRSRANSGVQVNLTTTGILETQIDVPSIQEQSCVARFLGALEDKIELNQKLNHILEEIAKAIFKSWFVDFDPVLAKAEGRPTGLPPEISDLFPDELVGSEIAEVPKGWHLTKLEDSVSLEYGKALKAMDRTPGNVPVYGSNGQVGWHNKKLVNGPGIIVGRKGNPGIVTWTHSDFYPIDTTFYAKSKLNLPLSFLYRVLQSMKLEKLSADSAVPGLNRNAAYMENQIIPANEVLEVYSIIAHSFLQRQHLAEQENHCLEQLRDTLLPKLISGELRIHDVEKFLEEAGV